MHSVRWRGMEGYYEISCLDNLAVVAGEDEELLQGLLVTIDLRSHTPGAIPSHPSVNSSGNQKTALPDPAGANRLRTRVGGTHLQAAYVSLLMSL